MQESGREGVREGGREGGRGEEMGGEGGGEKGRWGIHYESWNYSHESWRIRMNRGALFHQQSLTLLQHTEQPVFSHYPKNVAAGQHVSDFNPGERAELPHFCAGEVVNLHTPLDEDALGVDQDPL